MANVQPPTEIQAMTRLKSGTVLMVLLAAFLTFGLAVGGVFAGGTGGPLDDSGTEEPCLGPHDPFCHTSGDGEGGGSSSVDCTETQCRDCKNNTLPFECKYVDYAAHCSCTATANTCTAEDVCNVQK